MQLWSRRSQRTCSSQSRDAARRRPSSRCIDQREVLLWHELGCASGADGAARRRLPLALFVPASKRTALVLSSGSEHLADWPRGFRSGRNGTAEVPALGKRRRRRLDRGHRRACARSLSPIRRDDSCEPFGDTPRPAQERPRRRRGGRHLFVEAAAPPVRVSSRSRRALLGDSDSRAPHIVIADPRAVPGHWLPARASAIRPSHRSRALVGAAGLPATFA
jgi:hypothetical protein